MIKNRVYRRFLRNRLAVVGVAIILLFCLAALLANWVAPHDPYALNLENAFALPGSPGHILGTDNFGRDILSRLIFGSRISLFVGILAVLIALTVGTVLGLSLIHI